MNIRIVLMILIISFTYIDGKGQCKYDTIVYGCSQFSDLKFQLGSTQMTLFEVNENEISVRNGEIEKNTQSRDTIGIRYFKVDDLHEGYEIKLSDKTWSKTLFGRQCIYLEKRIENYPNLLFQRNKLSKKLSFLEPKIVGEFIKTNYQKRIDCIDSSEDKFMKEYLIKWISMIESDSINEFSTSFSSHFFHVLSLYDLIVPINYHDTLVCKLSNTSLENSNNFSYQTNKQLNSDSTITYHYTDKVDSENSYTNQFVGNFYNLFKKYYSDEEKSTNKIRLKSIISEDKSYIELTKTGVFKRYLRISESFMLDSKFNPIQSIYNYEIKEITTSNKL